MESKGTNDRIKNNDDGNIDPMKETPKARTILGVLDERIEMKDAFLDKEQRFFWEEDEELPKYGLGRSANLGSNKTEGQEVLEYDISLPDMFDNDVKKRSQLEGRTRSTRRGRKGWENNQNKVINLLDSYISFSN